MATPLLTTKLYIPLRLARSFGNLTATTTRGGRTGSFDWAQDEAGATPALG